MSNDSDDCQMFLPVGSIGWAQDSIASTFRNGEDLRNAHLAFRRLTNAERLDIIRTYPPIRVVQFETQGWITLDNRRLYLFRSVLDPGTHIPVRIATYQEAQELRYKLTTRDSGATIVVRANPNH
ncbi:hypothetical protein CVT24_003071 [Panaeolus cyanescens]|uniref:Uncharacterized protein n=1 Tax=Panaeolus cyanescens TaxID=181874 RepID=A0A409VFT7_9AGAR|nr:hypothetical protein CVT24_003071 [Panaeolus cyanescens]